MFLVGPLNRFPINSSSKRGQNSQFLNFEFEVLETRESFRWGSIFRPAPRGIEQLAEGHLILDLGQMLCGRHEACVVMLQDLRGRHGAG